VFLSRLRLRCFNLSRRRTEQLPVQAHSHDEKSGVLLLGTAAGQEVIVIAVVAGERGCRFIIIMRSLDLRRLRSVRVKESLGRRPSPDISAFAAGTFVTKPAELCYCRPTAQSRANITGIVLLLSLLRFTDLIGFPKSRPKTGIESMRHVGNECEEIWSRTFPGG